MTRNNKYFYKIMVSFPYRPNMKRKILNMNQRIVYVDFPKYKMHFFEFQKIKIIIFFSNFQQRNERPYSGPTPTNSNYTLNPLENIMNL